MWANVFWTVSVCTTWCVLICAYVKHVSSFLCFVYRQHRGLLIEHARLEQSLISFIVFSPVSRVGVKLQCEKPWSLLHISGSAQAHIWIPNIWNVAHSFVLLSLLSLLLLKVATDIPISRLLNDWIINQIWFKINLHELVCIITQWQLQACALAFT